MQQIQNGLWNCLAAMGFLWVAMFFLIIIGSGRFGRLFTHSKKIKL
jgi:putative oxidoreductase